MPPKQVPEKARRLRPEGPAVSVLYMTPQADDTSSGARFPNVFAGLQRFQLVGRSVRKNDKAANILRMYAEFILLV